LLNWTDLRGLSFRGDCRVDLLAEVCRRRHTVTAAPRVDRHSVPAGIVRSLPVDAPPGSSSHTDSTGNVDERRKAVVSAREERRPCDLASSLSLSGRVVSAVSEWRSARDRRLKSSDVITSTTRTEAPPTDHCKRFVCEPRWHPDKKEPAVNSLR